MTTETYAGARELIEALPETAQVSVTTFNSNVTPGEFTMRDEALASLSERVANGGTALYDAIIDVINAQERRKPQSESVSIVVVTDGMDTASRKTRDEAKERIRWAQEQNWRITFLGTAGVTPTAQALGIPTGRILAYEGAQGMRQGLNSTRDASSRGRCGGSEEFTANERRASMQTAAPSRRVASTPCGPTPVTNPTVWVSVDPRTGDVHPYPEWVCTLIETANRGVDTNYPITVALGTRFFNATIHLVSSTSAKQTTAPTPQTPGGGVRDVKRGRVGATVRVTMGPHGYEFVEQGGRCIVLTA